MKYQDNSIIIIPSSIKKNILLEINNLHKIINIKVYTINEFIENYYFSYNEETIYYVSSKYNVKEEIAKIYIENLYYVSNIDDEKVKFLLSLKEELSDKGLITTNPLFKESLKGKTIELVSIPKTKFNEKLIASLKEIAQVEIIEEENNYTHSYKHFKTLDDEVVFTATEICRLINNNVDINKIYLTNLSNEHRLAITKYFKMFNIPVSLKNNNSLLGTPIVKKFLENYDKDINKSIEILKEDIKNEEDEYVYNSLVNIVNKYNFIDNYSEVKRMIINDLKHTKTLNKNLLNSVKEVDFIDYHFKDDDYVFLLHFNQGVIPTIYKDENYLNDKIMTQLNLDTSSYLNKVEKERIITKIKNVRNLYISYIDKSLSNKFYPSSLIEEMALEEDLNTEIPYIYSNLYNKIKLVSYTKTYQKYHTLNPLLPILKSNYDIKKYDNSFKGIDKDKLTTFLNHKLYLSYTSLSNYYHCAFKYYLSNILKLNIYEDTFMQIIGDIFHQVLENYFKKEKSFDALYEEAIKDMPYEYSLKERFFLRKLKSELKFVIDTIDNQNTYTNLKDELYEEKVVTNIEGNISITFSGKIDKIKYLNKDNKTIIAIIDYKTGNPELNLNNVIYGLDMQLPIYIYLAKNDEKLKNIEVAGFYLQKILNSEINATKDKSYLELKTDKLKLQGYSNEDYDILKEFDASYENSKVVKSLKVTNNGFYHYSKILSTNKMNQLVAITEKNIKEAAKNILNANFVINPKVIGGKNIGCEFCEYRHICYMTEKDTVNLKEYKDLEFLGGDDNA